MVRVFLVEDSPLVCERLEAMFASIAGTTTIGHAAGADEAVRKILSARPDAVVLDLNLAQGSGFDVLRAVHEQAPEIDVYVLSNFSGEPYRRRAERLGARGFFDKTIEFERVRDTLAARAAQTPC
ncbi:MAG TPA: response regulator [Burkholderiales bacterium]|nr:response regulator [Burkholderiales bacterium]